MYNFNQLMQATHQFLNEILTGWRASGGRIEGDMRNNFFLISPLIPQFIDPSNGYLYPHIHIILNDTNCMFVVSCDHRLHGTGSEISPNVTNPATGQLSTAQDFIDFFMLRLRQCPPAPAPAPVFSGFGAAAPAAAPATNPLAFRPRQVARPPPMQTQRFQAPAPMQTDDSMNGGKRRMIKKTKTQRRRRCARRRSNGNKSRRTKRSKSN
jgi:hypothetical protein